MRKSESTSGSHGRSPNGGVEAPDLVARVPAGRGQEEDPRHRGAGELQDELVEARIARRRR
jgi:hypothetical protein